MSIKNKIIKRLFAKSGNICAFPNCHEKLCIDENNNSNIAHIISKKTNGPRHDPNYNEYDDEKNLILLCQKHHNIIDRNESQYTVEILRNMKYNHEKEIDKRLSDSDSSQKTVEKFLKTALKCTNIIANKVDFVAPFNITYINTFDKCYIEIDNLLQHTDILYCDKKVLNLITKYNEDLKTLLYYSANNSKSNPDTTFIVPNHNINKNYVLELRKNLCYIYYNLQSSFKK
ncbi:HNH endonuclease (plasmid) [Clostridium botulinum]|nr:HNH endonuclease signature motif containing protein [Clostridium botulinum]QPW56414.1 HNH endonuclease [Clostridium botulinum]